MSFCLWNQCGHLFDSPESLGQHLDMVHVQEQADMENPAFSCQWNQCKRVGIVITTRKNLLAHLRQHTGELPCLCTFPGCGQRFVRPDALRKHERLAHSQSDEDGIEHDNSSTPLTPFAGILNSDDVPLTLMQSKASLPRKRSLRGNEDGSNLHKYPKLAQNTNFLSQPWIHSLPNQNIIPQPHFNNPAMNIQNMLQYPQLMNSTFPNTMFYQTLDPNVALMHSVAPQPVVFQPPPLSDDSDEDTCSFTTYQQKTQVIKEKIKFLMNETLQFQLEKDELQKEIRVLKNDKRILIDRLIAKRKKK